MKRYALMCALGLAVVFGATAIGQAVETVPQLDKGTTEHHWGGRRSHRGGHGWRSSRGGHWGGGYSRHGNYYYN